MKDHLKEMLVSSNYEQLFENPMKRHSMRFAPIGVYNVCQRPILELHVLFPVLRGGGIKINEAMILHKY